MQQLTTRSWRRLKSVLSPLPPRAANDYATHVPVLIGLAAIRRVERVLEFGCGNYSTKTFLNRSAFPHLKELRSVENDAVWARTMSAAIAHDKRCTITLTPGAMAEAVSTFDIESFDLIFVDDSTTSEQRAATIRAISVLQPRNPWLLIHDYEVDDYRKAASAFNHRFTFKAYNPYTGLVFNRSGVNRFQLKVLDQRLKENSLRLEPDDIIAWTRALHK